MAAHGIARVERPSPGEAVEGLPEALVADVLPVPPRRERAVPLWPIWIVLAAVGLALLSPELQGTLASAVDAFAH